MAITERNELHKAIIYLLKNRDKEITYKDIAKDNANISASFIGKVLSKNKITDLSAYRMEKLFSYFTNKDIMYIEDRSYNYRYLLPYRSRLHDTVCYLLESRPTNLTMSHIVGELNKNKRFDGKVKIANLYYLMNAGSYSRDLGIYFLYDVLEVLVGKPVTILDMINYMPTSRSRSRQKGINKKEEKVA